MNYHIQIKGLIAEAKKGLQYQRVSGAAKFFLILGMIPLIVSAFLQVCTFYVTLFFYKGFIAPLEYLHKVVKNEGQETKHATQFAIYWISWPFIFFLHVFQSLMAMTFYFQWFVLMLNVYLVTLGGVRWQPFLLDADYSSEEVYVPVKQSDSGVKSFVVVLAIFDALVAVGILLSGASEFGMVLGGLGYLGITVMLYIVNPASFRIAKYVPAPVVEEAPAVEAAE